MSVQTGPEELLIALRCVRDTLDGGVKGNVTGRRAETDLEGVLLLLNRLIGELAGGAAVGAEQLSRWQELRAAVVPAEPPASSQGDLGRNGKLARLGDQMIGIQGHLADVGRFDRIAAATQRPGSAEGGWFAAVAAATLDFLECYEGAMPVAPASGDEGAQASSPDVRAELDAYLRDRFPDLPVAPIETFFPVPGGRAKFTVLVGLKPNPVLPRRLVLRADTSLGFTGTKVATEFPVLKELNRRGLEVPAVVMAETQPTAIGESFLIMKEIEGATGAGAPFPEERRASGLPSSMGPAFGREIATFLARMHAVKSVPDAADYGWTGGAPDPQSMVADYLSQYRALPRPPLFSIATDLGFCWLKGNPLPPDRPRGLVHGDFGAHNILVRDGHLAAVLDWELAHLGDPAEDIGYCRLMLLEETIAWEEFVAAYVEAGGDPAACDPRAVSYYAIWSQVKNGVIGAVLRNGLTTAPETAGIDAVSGHWHYLPRIHQYLSRELNRALDLTKKAK